jgi:hypothetical protein
LRKGERRGIGVHALDEQRHLWLLVLRKGQVQEGRWRFGDEDIFFGFREAHHHEPRTLAVVQAHPSANRVLIGPIGLRKHFIDDDDATGAVPVVGGKRASAKDRGLRRVEKCSSTTAEATGALPLPPG